jgi:Terpene cyclase DEP1
MTTSLVFYAVLGVAATALAFGYNRSLFTGGTPGRPSVLELLYYVIGVASVCLGWYFNIRYVHTYGHEASYVNYTKMLFANWASDSAAQDYTVVNVLLLPLWTIVDGRRRGLRIPWIFFVMSLFTSLAFSMAIYLAFVERQVRYEREPETASRTAYPQL